MKTSFILIVTGPSPHVNRPKDHRLHPVPTASAPETRTVSKQATARRRAGPLGSRALDADVAPMRACWEINPLIRAPVSIGVTPGNGASTSHRQRASTVSWETPSQGEPFDFTSSSWCRFPGETLPSRQHVAFPASRPGAVEVGHSVCVVGMNVTPSKTA